MASSVEKDLKDMTLENNVDQNEDLEDEEDVVDPWSVTSKSDKGVDYDKLISKLV